MADLIVRTSPTLIYALGLVAGKAQEKPPAGVIWASGLDVDRARLFATSGTTALVVDTETLHNLPIGGWAHVDPPITRVPTGKQRTEWVPITCKPVASPETDYVATIASRLEGEPVPCRFDPSLGASLLKALAMLTNHVEMTGYAKATRLTSVGWDAKSEVWGVVANLRDPIRGAASHD